MLYLSKRRREGRAPLGLRCCRFLLPKTLQPITDTRKINNTMHICRKSNGDLLVYEFINILSRFPHQQCFISASFPRLSPTDRDLSHIWTRLPVFLPIRCEQRLSSRRAHRLRHYNGHATSSIQDRPCLSFLPVAASVEERPSLLPGLRRWDSREHRGRRL